ncbi:Beta-peptidyl aminopeptidase BapA [Dyadobacter sp. CECT 9623]|uniref:Beta-peptidyl aminopeptidase BapA n=1 Tax=Dyadobacter linearis TaxID=2823330 RepID=A0ABN7RDH6_9BACT|nr:P1 family peptidase [Dyadobacter sp. CECT 9623]CAG5073683.1 Beta-peptidyl aminopeptidase BapA [Dyadobacter sp. CECT 9623]
MKKPLLLSLLALMPIISFSQNRPRDLGIKIGVLPVGALNAITDVPGVKVGQVTLTEGADVRTGVTAIVPHDGNLFQQKVQAAMYIGNGFGKMTGYSQVEELGTIESPIVLTNTLSVPTAADAIIDWTLGQKGNESVRSVNPVVGETNDGFLNDIRGRHVRKEHILNALAQAENGAVAEGNVGAGTGTVCFGWKGGIGTASRKLPQKLGGYTVGVLVQTNFGGVLKVNGVPVGQELGQYAFKEQLDKSSDGSCMMVLATDAPLDARNLKRLAKRVFLGMAQTGGIAANGSGDYVIAFSTANRVLHDAPEPTATATFLTNDVVSPLFMAAMESTEEAIINSLFMAKTMEGTQGHKVEELPEEKVLEIMRKYGRL